MRKMSSRNSLLTHFLPARDRCLESQVQYNLNPARCQRTTVSGWTRINARRQPTQSRCSITPEEFVRQSKPGLRMLLFENTELLPKSKIFQKQIAARAKESSKENNKET